MPRSRVGEVELYYEITDFTEPWRSGAKPVVLIHGLGGTHGFWFYQARDLCRLFPIITLDLRGHGQSSRVEQDFTMSDMALDVARLLRNLGAESVHVVGLSLGGMVVQQLALDCPHVVASLVLADTYCGPPLGFERVMADALRFIEENQMADVARARITNAFSDHVDPSIREHCIAQVAQNDKTSYVHAARAAFRFDVRKRLAEISVPTLVIVGEEDRVTPPPLSEEIASFIPGAVLRRISASGHISNIECPEEFNRALLEFLAHADRAGKRSYMPA
jgi:3-oxoadipate enol-lactonase